EGSAGIPRDGSVGDESERDEVLVGCAGSRGCDADSVGWRAESAGCFGSRASRGRAGADCGSCCGYSGGGGGGCWRCSGGGWCCAGCWRCSSGGCCEEGREGCGACQEGRRQEVIRLSVYAGVEEFAFRRLHFREELRRRGQRVDLPKSWVFGGCASIAE